MLFSVAAALAALASVALAKPVFTNSDFTITQGVPFTLTWSGATGPVTITVATGSANNLKVVETIDSGDSGDHFTWTPSNLPSGTYAFEITDSTGTNYSEQWTYVGTGSLTSTPASSTATSSSTRSRITTLSTSTTNSTSSSTSTDSSSTTKKSSSTSSTSTSTSTTSSAGAATSTAKVPNTNDGPKGQSPLAFILVTLATLLYFN